MYLSQIKIIFSGLSSLLVIYALFPYIRDVFQNKVLAHPFTWLIFGITQSITVAGILYGGGGLIGVLSLVIGTILVWAVFFLSLRQGKIIIAKSDVIIFILALTSIFFWLQLDNPMLSMALAISIDVSGYIPTFRKSYNDPWNEPIQPWVVFTLASAFFVMALQSYNFFTTGYTIVLSTANISLVIFLLIRKKIIV